MSAIFQKLFFKFSSLFTTSAYSKIFSKKSFHFSFGVDMSNEILKGKGQLEFLRGVC